VLTSNRVESVLQVWNILGAYGKNFALRISGITASVLVLHYPRLKTVPCFPRFGLQQYEILTIFGQAIWGFFFEVAI
jgi:hypothetical protein